ncbi:hypothetical protein KPH14_008985 [Odynerus spinipes]|uniref:SAM domain-containing protein n=1 Tax=Odynerus spinipes TaxID=1348599 RepID=A0AAD9VQ63_9HYME|nr:hypothetical protein KPH14_008985 [Odynerus spinipes]
MTLLDDVRYKKYKQTFQGNVVYSKTKMLSQTPKSNPVEYCSTGILINGKHRPWLPSPIPLYTSTGNIVNDLPLPHCWCWNTIDVINWLKNTICLPQYAECFTKNLIDGRRLLLIDASTCTKIGIHDFTHIKLIMDGIRKLYNVEREKFNRSINLPPRYPWTHYLLYRVPTGPTRERTKPVELFKKMGILHFEECCPLNHWKMLLPKWPDFPTYLIGRTKRKNVYIREEHKRQPRCHTYYKHVQHYPSYYIEKNVNKKSCFDG